MHGQYLVVPLEEVIQVVPFTDWIASRVQAMPTSLLEVVLPPVHQPAHPLHKASLILMAAVS